MVFWLQEQLQKRALISREEFDIQATVLARTRAKLEVLEERVRTLESRHP